MCRGELNHAKPAQIKYTPGDPGCWWIKTGDFVNGAGLEAMDEITTDLILDVRPAFPYLYLNTSDQLITENLESLQGPRQR